MKKNKALVSIIIVNWNGGRVLCKCLKSVTKLSYKPTEVIIVDNNSNKEEISWLEKYIKKNKYILIKNTENKGFAPANNQALKKARGKYLLLLNNDTTVPSNLIEMLLKRMRVDNKLAVIQPKILLLDKPDYLDNAGSFLTKTGLLSHWGFMEKDSKKYDQEMQIFSAKGACMLIKANIVAKIGLFDDDFISYFEESDFCWRVWLAGFSVLYYPKVSIYHKVGFTSKRMDQVRITLISTRNRISSLFKNLNTANLILILLPHLIFLIFTWYFHLI